MKFQIETGALSLGSAAAPAAVRRALASNVSRAPKSTQNYFDKNASTADDEASTAAPGAGALPKQKFPHEHSF
jgi:hypothetical protein